MLKPGDKMPSFEVLDQDGRAVIERALAMGRNYDINENMLYAAAACHDLGLLLLSMVLLYLGSR